MQQPQSDLLFALVGTEVLCFRIMQADGMVLFTQVCVQAYRVLAVGLLAKELLFGTLSLEL